jgi:hypothetical protein
MENKNTTAKLEKQIKTLEFTVKVLAKSVHLLERENNRRKLEINQITSALRKG